MKEKMVYEGPITMTRKGIGFFSHDEKKDDLIIPPEATLHALHGDIVKVESTGTYRDPVGRQPPREAVMNDAEGQRGHTRRAELDRQGAARHENAALTEASAAA